MVDYGYRCLCTPDWTTTPSLAMLAALDRHRLEASGTPGQLPVTVLQNHCMTGSCAAWRALPGPFSFTNSEVVTVLVLDSQLRPSRISSPSWVLTKIETWRRLVRSRAAHSLPGSNDGTASACSRWRLLDLSGGQQREGRRSSLLSTGMTVSRMRLACGQPCMNRGVWLSVIGSTALCLDPSHLAPAAVSMLSPGSTWPFQLALIFGPGRVFQMASPQWRLSPVAS